MKRCVFIVAFLLSAGLFAQDNLVPNWSFEEVEKKVKMDGMIEMANGWKSPTLAPADLYVTNTKNFLISVPENAYGEEKPMKGNNYAGILAYSYKEKESRSYLQVKLSEPLKPGQEYCVTFNVSLADLSKYACNHLGAYISKNEVSADNDNVFQFEPQVVSRKLSVYTKQFYWTPICGKFKAAGGEQFLTLGNFTLEEKLTLTKVKRPKGFSKPQTYDAYYYIDNVSVKEFNSDKGCDCDAVPGEEDLEAVSRSFSSEPVKKTGTSKIINSDGSVTGDEKAGVEKSSFIIAFDSKSFSIKGDATTKLNQLVELLKENKKKIVVEGYFDKSEKEVPELDEKRTVSVYKYLVSQGVAKERIDKKGAGQGESGDVMANTTVVISIVN